MDRWSHHEPILARPSTTFERVQKWVRRRPAVAALSATSILFLLTIAIGATVASIRLKAGRNAAEANRDEAEANLYVAETAMAFAAWDRGSASLPRILLDNQRPKPRRPDLRGFEWHYLDALWRTQPSPLFTFPPGSDAIFGLACSPAGRLVAAGQQDGKIQLLDFVTRRVIGVLQSQTQWVYSVAFSPDGKRLVSSNPRKRFDVWDVEKQILVTNLLGHSTFDAIGVAWSRDGRRIATTSAGSLYNRTLPGEIFVWDGNTYEKLFALEGHSAGPWKPAFSPDSRLLATPHTDGTILLWDLNSRRPVRTFGLINGSLFDPLGDSENRVINPGSLKRSVLLTRIANLGREHMPPLATTVLNSQAIKLLRDWITNGLAKYQSYGDWQLANFGSTNALNAAPDLDADGDGAINQLEYLTGTNPLLAGDGWGIRLAVAETQAEIQFPRIANRGFEVQWTTNLVDPNSWQPVDVARNEPLISATSSTVSVQDQLTSAPRKFYRVRILEP
ncbi:MAG: hypothetical protein ABI651_07790 [Verrucomicrobiota bacterium]